MTDRLDLDRLVAGADLPAIVGRYVQDLRPNGREFEACCPFHEDRSPSFNLFHKGDKWRWICHAGCGRGDAVDFLQAIDNVDRVTAIKRLRGELGLPDQPTRAPRPAAAEPDYIPVLPVPENAPELDPEAGIWNPKRGRNTVLRPSRTFAYRDAEGRLLGYVLRCEFEDGGKWTPTVTACVEPHSGLHTWALVPFPRPRPLYGLDRLAAAPQAKVLVVEGEKAADAAQRLLPAFAVVSWPGGAAGAKHADWSPLTGRDVLLWPDADAPGLAVMREIAELAGAARTRIVDASGQPDGWDLADAEAEGWTGARVAEWAKPRISVVEATARAEAPTTGQGGSNDRGGGEVPAQETRAAKAPSKRSTAPAGRQSAADPGLPPSPGRRRTRADMGVVEGDGTVRQAAPATPPAAEAPPSAFATWESLGLALNDRMAPIANVDNVVRVLEQHPLLAGRFWFDEFHGRFFTSWAPAGDARGTREHSDADDLALAVWMQRNLSLTRFGDDLVSKGIRAYGMRSPRCEPRDWFDTLTWDGIPRVEEFLSMCFGAPDDAYTRAASRNFLVGMVARVYQPGCKVDSMLVLEGEQGVGKSSALAALGGPWYAEAHESVTSKDFFMVLAGKLIIEIGEMDAFSRAETTRVKQVITCQTDRYRAPYARAPADYPRRCVFVGTTNEDAYLRDHTGGRRFWPIRCARIDRDRIEDLREQLFAEATRLVKAGEKWWLMPTTDTAAAQEQRRQADVWEEVIAAWVSGRVYATTEEVIEQLGMKLDRADMATQFRIGRIMRSLGWESRPRRVNGRLRKVWSPRGAAGGSGDLPLGGAE